MKEFRDLVLAIEAMTERKVESSTVVSSGEVPVYLSHLALDGREFVLALAPTAYAPARARAILEGAPLALGARVVNDVTGQAGEVVEELPGGRWRVSLDEEEGTMYVRPTEVREETEEDVAAQAERRARREEQEKGEPGRSRR